MSRTEHTRRPRMARPRTKTVYLKLDETFYRQLLVHAQRRGCDVDDLIRHTLHDRYLPH